MNRVFPLSVVVGIVLSQNLLFAQPPGRGGPPGSREGGGPPIEMIIRLFTQVDANQDGSVTKAELTTVLQALGRGNQGGRGGLPPQRGNAGQGNAQGQHQRPQGDNGGPPPEPGQVLPQPVAESLNLTDRQTRQLAALQADVTKRLAAILTDEQEEQLKNARPPHGPDHAGEQPGGDRAEGRPRRPE